MTSISNVTGYDASSYLTAIKSTSGSSVSSDAGTDEDASTQATSGHHHRGGGGMGKALMETMQQLGITPPAPPADAADASSSDSSSTPATGDLQSDFGSFMTQLFQALQAESGNSSGNGNGTGDGSSSSPGGRFAAALSSLTTDVANGSAPAGLQSAYTQLMQDLQGGTGTSTNSDAGSSSTSTPDLQAFLSTLQQNLAQYGQHQMAVGNVVSTQA